MKILQTIYRVFDVARTAIITVLFASVIVICAIDVFLRYMPGFSSLGWAEEVLRYFNVWIIFLGASIGVKRSVHIQITYFSKMTGKKLALVIERVVAVTVIAILCVFVVLGIQKTIHNIPQRCQSLPFSIAVFYAAIPVGFAYMLVDYMVVFFKNVTLFPSMKH